MATGDEIILEGELLKQQPGLTKMWQRRWFELFSSHLVYRKHANDPKPKARVPLAGTIVHAVNTEARHVIHLKTATRVYVLAASTRAERDWWLDGFRKSYATFKDSIQARKMALSSARTDTVSDFETEIDCESYSVSEEDHAAFLFEGDILLQMGKKKKETILFARMTKPMLFLYSSVETAHPTMSLPLRGSSWKEDTDSDNGGLLSCNQKMYSLFTCAFMELSKAFRHSDAYVVLTKDGDYMDPEEQEVEDGFILFS